MVKSYLEQIITICARSKHQWSTAHIFILEKSHWILPSHARFAWDTSRDHDDVGTLESLLEAIISWESAVDLGRSRNVRDIRRDTRCVDDIKQPQLLGEFGVRTRPDARIRRSRAIVRE